MKIKKFLFSIQNKDKVILFFLILVGFSLRIYQLGDDSFWIDEIGVASVIFSKSTHDFINIVRSHVAAVPLDYVITWIIGQITLDEGWLRLPSVIWGTGTLIVGFQLFKKITNKKIALAGVTLMVFSPLLIKYSQELRFYSSEIFFYLLSTKLILDALHSNNNNIGWVFFIIVTLIGIFFHIFVAFSLVNGFYWYFQKHKDIKSPLFRRLIISYILIILGLLLAYYLFAGYNSKLTDSLSQYAPVWHAISVGLGWYPFVQPNSFVFYFFGLFCLIFEIIGIFIVFKYEKESLLAALCISILTQLLLIILLLIIRNYFIYFRQFIFLQPLLLLFCAKGCFFCGEQIKQKKFFVWTTQFKNQSFLIILILCFSSIPILNSHYLDDRGNALRTAVFLSERWEQGDLLIFFPYGFSAEEVKYYLINKLQKKELLSSIWALPLSQDLLSMENWNTNKKIFLIGQASREEENLIIKSGFYLTEVNNVWIKD